MFNCDWIFNLILHPTSSLKNNIGETYKLFFELAFIVQLHHVRLFNV